MQIPGPPCAIISHIAFFSLSLLICKAAFSRWLQSSLPAQIFHNTVFHGYLFIFKIFRYFILYVSLPSTGKQLTRPTAQAESQHKNYLRVDKHKIRTDSFAKAKDLLFFPFLQIVGTKGWFPDKFQSKIEKRERSKFICHFQYKV